MKVLITGTSRGIGRAAALRFLREGHVVIGLDIAGSTIEDPAYTHLIADISDPASLPAIDGVEILINNAGVQESGRDIDVNLKGTIFVTEKYAFQDAIRAVLFNASASASTGAEFPEYTASKGGVVAYMKNTALRLAKRGAVCNSLSAGGVTTELNAHIMEDPTLWQQVLDETLLGKWASPEEMADFIYFMTVINKSMTGQDILVDNGEALRSNFIW